LAAEFGCIEEIKFFNAADTCLQSERKIRNIIGNGVERS
jgi:hypothetical protein